MEWIVLIVIWLLSYFLSKKSGARSGTAALVATGVTAGAYYSGASASLANGATKLISPGAPTEGTVTTGSTTGSPAVVGPATSALGTLGSVATGALSTAGNVLKDWGPAGTAGVIATTSLVSDGIDKKWLWIGAIGLGVFVLTK